MNTLHISGNYSDVVNYLWLQPEAPSQNGDGAGMTSSSSYSFVNAVPYIPVTRDAAKQFGMGRLHDMADDDQLEGLPIIDSLDAARMYIEKNRIPLEFCDPECAQLIVRFLETNLQQTRLNNPATPVEKPVRSNDIRSVVKTDWLAAFLEEIPIPLLIRLANASAYLDIPLLIDAALARIASLVYNKEPDETIRIFGIDPNFIDRECTIEEQKRIRNENPWIFRIGLGRS